MIRLSESLDKIIPALVAAKGEMGGLVKNRENPHFKSYFADLAQVVNVSQPALLANGLVVIQSAGETLDTGIFHVSGQYIICEGYELKSAKPDPQGHASAVSYARRYSAQAALMMAAEDDDGNAASGTLDDDLLETLGKRLEALGHNTRATKLAALSKELGKPVPSADDLTSDEIKRVLAKLPKPTVGDLVKAAIAGAK